MDWQRVQRENRAAAERARLDALAEELGATDPGVSLSTNDVGRSVADEDADATTVTWSLDVSTGHWSRPRQVIASLVSQGAVVHVQVQSGRFPFEAVAAATPADVLVRTYRQDARWQRSSEGYKAVAETDTGRWWRERHAWDAEAAARILLGDCRMDHTNPKALRLRLLSPGLTVGDVRRVLAAHKPDD